MPRDSSGVFKLVAGNPVAPDTVIESDWANSTMDDIALGLTGSLARSGVAPMLGPLVLSADPIAQSRQAVSKEYVDKFLAYATGMPMGAITAFASNGVPPGWLLCNGQAVSRTTYADLFTTIGTIYGVGDGTTTFNVPDLRDEFIRGLGGSNVLGTHYAASLAAHTHGITDPGHYHSIGVTSGATSNDHAHGFSAGTSTAGDHAHVFDPNLQPYTLGGGAVGLLRNTGTNAVPAPHTNTTGAHAHTVSGATGGQDTNHTHTVSGNTNTSPAYVTTGSTGGTETAPQHMVMNYIIKAIEDAPASGTVVTVTVASVVPATAPPFVGAMYVDQVLNKVYVATGTAASTDWSLLN